MKNIKPLTLTLNKYSFNFDISNELAGENDYHKVDIRNVTY